MKFSIILSLFAVGALASPIASPDPFLKDRLPITTVDEISNQLYGAWDAYSAECGSRACSVEMKTHFKRDFAKRLLAEAEAEADAK